MLTHYIIVRRDLPLGVLAAMVTHAADESATHYLGDTDPDARFKGCRAVVLEAKDEIDLIKASKKLSKNGIQRVDIYENSGQYDGQLMSIGLVPVESEKIETVMRPFQLLKSLDIPDETGYID